MPSRENTSAAGRPASVTPTAIPLRQTRARSRLDNAPNLMTGLDHRGRALDPLSTDPENIIFDDVVRKLRARRKKKVIFRQRGETPESPTLNVKAAKRAQLKKKAPGLAPTPASSSCNSPPLSPSPLRLDHDDRAPRYRRSWTPSPSDSGSDGGVPLYPQSPSSSGSSDSGSDGGVPLTSQSSSESSSSSDSSGGVPLGPPSQSSSSGSGSNNDATHGSSTSPCSQGSSRSAGPSHSSSSSGFRGSPCNSSASHHSDHSDSGPSGAGGPLGDENQSWTNQPQPGPPRSNTPVQSDGPLPANPPEAHGSLPLRPQAVSPDANEDTPMVGSIKTINSRPPFTGDAVDGFEPLEGFSDDDEDESPRAATRRIRPGCSGDSLRKRRRSKDDGSGPQAAKKLLVEEDLSFCRMYNRPIGGQSGIAPQTPEYQPEEEDLYSPTYPIPVTEQSDINPFPSPEPSNTSIPGLAFLDAQNVSINTDNVSPKVLTPVEPPADFDSEIPGIYGSGKRPRLHYDWYEQYHRFGPDCQKVHGCQHSQFCHQCHADWHKAWSSFFKRQDEMDAEMETAANYDIRKGYLGTALGFEHSPMPLIEPTPPRGGKMRTHPARIAKEKLALMERMAKEN